MAKTPFLDTQNGGLFGDQNAQTMDFSSLSGNQTQHVSAQSGLDVPIHGNVSLGDATFTQDSLDLVIQSESNAKIVVQDYFTHDTPPNLTTDSGKVYSAKLIDGFLQNKVQQYAQDDQIVSDASPQPIGQITETTGEVTITRINGQVIEAQNGVLIYQGDVVETSGDGAVNIIFADESSFAISNDARMTIDEFIFDPASLDGISNFSMLQGVFVYTSGSIGAHDPDDVHIDTPIGSIGIRGTTIAGRIDGSGSNNEITIIEGAIVIRNGHGEHVLSTQYDTVIIESMNSPIVESGVLPPHEIMQRIQGVQGVAGSFFNSLQQDALQSDPQTTNEQLENRKATPDSDTTEPKDANTPSENSTDQKDGEALLDNGEGDKPLPKTNEQQKPKANATPDSKGEPQITLLDDGATNDGQDSVSGRSGSGATTPQTSPLGADGNNTGGENGGTSESGTPPPLVTGSDPLPTNPDVITPPTPPTGGGPRQNLNDPLGSANNIRVLSGLPDGEQYGFAVTTVLNTVTGFDDIVLLRGDVSNGSSGNFTVFAGNASIGSDNNLSGAVYEDITDNSPNTTNENIFSVTSGDFYGDGTHELMIGTPNGFNAQGSANDGYLYHIDLGGTLGPQQFDDYTIGVSTVNGDSINSRVGNSVANLGDINNDGFIDFGFTSPGAQTTQGVATLVTGSGDVSAPRGIHGYTGDSAADYLGGEIVGLGDINGDGYDDFAFGAYEGTLNGGDVNSSLNEVYIMLGDNVVASYSDKSDALRLTGGTGFGRHLSGVDDVNGDGYDDLLVSNNNSSLKLIMGENRTYVGTDNESSFTQFNLDVSPQGYVIEGAASAGDFNADGYSDFAVLMRNGTDIKISILFGGTGLAGTNADLQYLEDHPEMAYMIDYTLSSAPANGSYDMQFTSGDVNGDGFDDLIITDPHEDRAFIVEGGRIAQPSEDYIEGNNITADGDYKILTGTALNDTIQQNDHAGLTFKGGAGLDTFILDNALNGSSANWHQIDGGGGDNDRLVLDGGQGSIDLSNIQRNKIERIETIEVGTGNNLTLHVSQIFDMLKSSDNGELKITALGAGSTLEILSDTAHADDNVGFGDALLDLSAAGGVTPITDSGYYRYDIGNYELHIDQDFALITNIG